MTTNVTQFNIAVSRRARKLPEKKLLLFHKGLHLRVLRGVVFKTPVDTGRLRANWQTTLGSPTSDEIGDGGVSLGAQRRKKGKKGVKGSKSAINANVFAKAVSTLSGLKPFGKSFIFNNVTYAIYIEEGTPKIKAFAMVQRTLSELRGVL